MWGKNETNISFHLYYSQAHFRYVGRCERPGDNWNESVSNIFFTSGCVNRCYFMCSVACFREIYLFIQQTFKKSSCFVRNCKLQCRCSREVKTFLILQSFSGNMFVGLILMELLQWWNHVPALKKQFKNLLLKLCIWKWAESSPWERFWMTRGWNDMKGAKMLNH